MIPWNYFVYDVVVVVTFSSLARIWGECLTIYSLLVFIFLSFFGSGD